MHEMKSGSIGSYHVRTLPVGGGVWSDLGNRLPLPLHFPLSCIKIYNIGLDVIEVKELGE